MALVTAKKKVCVQTSWNSQQNFRLDAAENIDKPPGKIF